VLKVTCHLLAGQERESQTGYNALGWLKRFWALSHAKSLKTKET